MGFFSPLTDEHVSDALLPRRRRRTLKSPRWSEEDMWRLQLQHGCRHDRDGGVAVEISELVSNEYVTIHLDAVSVSPVAMKLELRLSVTSCPAGADSVRGVWPFVLATPQGSLHEGMFYLGGKPDDICRFGVRYSNGAWTQTGTGFRDHWFVWGEDDTGSHSTEALRMVFAGHSGGLSESRVSVLLYPPPPPGGPVELFLEWPGVGIEETSCLLSPELLESASGFSVPLSDDELAEIRSHLDRLGPEQ